MKLTKPNRNKLSIWDIVTVQGPEMFLKIKKKKKSKKCHLARKRNNQSKLNTVN